jgi:hypothetical protein
MTDIGDPLIKLLVYGDPGAGKTWLCGTFTQCPETAHVLVLNSRGQSITLRQFPDNPPCIYDVRTLKDYNFPYMWIRSGQPWDAILKGMDQEGGAMQPFCRTVYGWVARTGDLSNEVLADPTCPVPEFRTIVLDSLTQTQRLSLREITGDMGKLPGDIPADTSYRDWGKTLGQLTLLADKYFELPIHVVVTALRRHQFADAEGTVMYYPQFWGQSSTELPAFAEILGMLVNADSLPVQKAMGLRKAAEQAGAEVPYNVLITRGGRLHRAKWQGVRNPPEMVPNPTAAKLLQVMNR